MTRITFSLEAVPPFRLDLTAWCLRRRAGNVVDRWDGRTYRRVLPRRSRPVEIAVAQSGPPHEPRLDVTVTGWRLAAGIRAEVTETLNRMLGLQVDLSDFYRLAASDGRLGQLAARFRGMKPTRYPTLFETLVNAITCQQITLSFGLQVLGRMAEKYGAALEQPTGRVYAFPTPEDLAGRDLMELRALGLSSQKARALAELAGSIVEGNLALEELSGVGCPAAIERLLELRGVGRWTAEYALLRGLGRLSVFPGDDVGGRNYLQRWLGKKKEMNYEGVQRSLARWKPYQGLIYMHLLVDGLARKGALDPG